MTAPKRKIEAILPLSPLQQGMLFHSVFDEADIDVYTVQIVFDLDGTLDRGALQASAEALLARHANLRAGFRFEGLSEPVQVIARTVKLGWRDEDVSGADDPEAAAAVLVEEDRWARFDVRRPPLVRFMLVQLAPQRFRFVVSHHHILWDGWSTPVILRELMTLYRQGGDPAGLPPVRPFADYLTWLSQQDREESRQAWTTALAGLDGPTRVGSGSHAPLVPEQVRGGLDLTQTTRLRDQARAWGVTLNTVVQAAWAAVLSWETGRLDVVFGATVSGRPAELAGVETMVGLFINTVPVRVTVDPAEPLRDLASRVQAEQSRLVAHQHVGLTDIQAWAGLGDLFDTVTVFENYPVGTDAADEADTSQTTPLRIVGAEVRDATHYSLGLIIEPREALGLRLSYRPDTVDAASAQATVGRVVGLLAAMVDQPDLPVGALDMLHDHEHRLLVAHQAVSREPRRPGTTLDWFEEQVRETPDAVSVEAGGRKLTYAELDARASQLARVLVARGVGAESFVGVLLPRDEHLVTTLLAVWKAGGAYVPIDPEYPADRIDFILDDASLAVVVTRTGLAELAPAHAPRLVLDDPEVQQEVDAQETSSPDRPGWDTSAAYMIYTSGSTGRPKGVVVSRTNVANLVDWAHGLFGTAGLACLVQSTSQSFDVSVFELFAPITCGGRLRIVENLLDLADPSVTAGATLVSGVPSAMANVLTTHEGLRWDVDTVVVAGEAFTSVSLSTLRDAAPRASVVNCYGPTEATVYATVWEADRQDAERQGGEPGIGRPLSNVRLHVLDAALRPVRVGVPGDLYIAGDGLARGYWRRPRLTSTRFVADVYGDPGDRMYRTGDLVQWDGTGQLEFLGRADDQVKIRGYRIEPGEIESALAEHDDVAHAVVVPRAGAGGMTELVAYVVGEAGAEDEGNLRAHLRERLPDYMVPTAIGTLDELPLNPSGKVDRKALPDLEATRDGVELRMPRTPREEILCELFAEVLAVQAVGIDDSFFELGGHSLLATRLISRIRSVLRVDLSLREFFASPSVIGVCEQIDAGGEPRDPLTRVVPRPDRLPLSFAQQRLWFIHQLEGPNASYNIPLAVRLHGQVDAEAMRAALADVADRHESLRTRFAEDDLGPVQVVAPRGELSPELVEREVAEEDVTRELADAAREPFDLERDAPLRARLLRISDDESVFVVVVHHVAADGWSLRPLLRDITTAYTARLGGAAPGWAPLPVQYANYTLWQRARLGSDQDTNSILSQQVRYWSEQLDGMPEELALPLDRPRPTWPTYLGGKVPVVVSPEVHEGLVTVAQRNGCSVFMVVHAAVATLLSRLGAGDDVAIGTPVAGRVDDVLTDLVGFFVNTLVLRTDLSGDPSFAQLLDRVRTTDLAAFQHQEVPFERLVEEVRPERVPARHPLVQTLLTFNNIGDLNAGEDAVTPDGLTVSPERPESGSSKFDLLFGLDEGRGDDGRPRGIRGSLEFSADLFDVETAQRISAALTRLLTDVVTSSKRRLSQLQVVDPLERQTQLLAWNDTATPEPHLGLAATFEAQVARTPAAVAVVTDHGEMTYADLDARASALASVLRAHGAGADSVVAVALDRGESWPVAVLATWKAGSAYLPLDVGHPGARNLAVLQDARPVLVLTLASLTDRLGDHGVPTVLVEESGAAVDATAGDRSSTGGEGATAVARPEDAAYVLFTSGSTGRPKGVVMTARGLLNLAAWHGTVFADEDGTRTAAFTAATFDVSVQELTGALFHGKTLVLCPDEVRRDPRELARWLDRHRVRELFAPTLVLESVARAAVEEGLALPDLMTVVQAGEALTPGPALKELFAAGGRRLFNNYGPTETHVTTGHVVDGPPAEWQASLPIGTPVHNTSAYVLDAQLSPVAVGVRGELYLAGASLARGYLGRGGLTAERFVADPLGPAGTRMYRTGDVVRWRRDGVLEYLGRSDHQVKVRGFRVELGEIESALLEHPSATQCVVLQAPDDATRLVAYVVPAEGSTLEDLDPAVLRRHVGDRLPAYMVPSGFVPLERIPLTTNGKLDRRALPEVGDAASVPTRTLASSPQEELVCELFGEVLGTQGVGVEDNFFDLGGHSMLAVTLLRRIESTLGVRMTVRDIFEQPTPQGLCARLGVESDSDPFASLLPLRSGGDRRPLFCLHPGSGLSWCYSGLLKHLPADQPVYGLQARRPSLGESFPPTMEEMAADYLTEIRKVQASGPYRLLGWSFGGQAAFALATLLQEQGEQVELLTLVDSFPNREDGPVNDRAELMARRFRDQGVEVEGASIDEAADGEVDDLFAAYVEAVRVEGGAVAELRDDEIRDRFEIYVNNVLLMQRYRPSTFRGDLLFVTGSHEELTTEVSTRMWLPFLDGSVDEHQIDVPHGDMLRDPGVLTLLGDLLEQRLVNPVEVAAG